MSGMAVAAKRYAKALFEVARENGTVEETQVQLAAIAQSLSSDEAVRAFFDHPNIGNDVKIQAVRNAVGDKLSEPVKKTLELLVERGRGSALNEVVEAYSRIADEALGRGHAVVTSTFELTQEQQDGIAKQFSALTGKKITIETKVDKALLGGIRVRIGDTLYDGSLSSKLAEMERSFNKAR